MKIPNGMRCVSSRGLGLLFRRICQRSFFLYVIVILLVLVFVDAKKAKIKSLNGRRVPLDDLVLYSEGKKDLSLEVFYNYIIYFKRILVLNAGEDEVYGLLGYCYHQLGDVPRSVAFYQKALAHDSPSFWFPYDLGMIYFELADYQQAITMFEKALSQSKDLTLFLIQSSPVFRIEKKSLFVNVKENLEKAYEKCPQWLTLCYYYLHDDQRLLAVAQKALDHKTPREAFFLYYAGVASYDLGDYRRALYYFKKCLEIKPFNSQVLSYLGRCFRKLGNEKSAQKIFSASETLRKDQIPVASFGLKPKLRLF